MVLRHFWGWFLMTDWRWGLGLFDGLRIMSLGTRLILWLMERWSLLDGLNGGGFGWDLRALVAEGGSSLLWYCRDALDHGPAILFNYARINKSNFLFNLFLSGLHTFGGT